MPVTTHLKMKKNPLLILVLIFVSIDSIGQTFVDQIIMKSGDTIPCTITLVNDQNIFYKYEGNRSRKNNHVSLESVNLYNWTSKDIKYKPKPENSGYPYDSTNNWNFGIKLTQQVNYPILHTSPTFSIYRKNHNLYIGPEYTNLLEESFGDPADNYQHEYWGINIGYRYIFDSHWKKTNLFLQMDFSFYQLKYTEHQLGNPQETNNKRTIVENNLGIGVNYQLFEQIEIFGGVGFGSTNGFFLMVEQFIPHSFLGIEYKIKE